jgi:hypothetical protein
MISDETINYSTRYKENNNVLQDLVKNKIDIEKLGYPL